MKKKKTKKDFIYLFFLNFLKFKNYFLKKWKIINLETNAYISQK